MSEEICKYQMQEGKHFGCSRKKEENLFSYKCGTFISLNLCSILEKEKLIKAIVSITEYDEIKLNGMDLRGLRILWKNIKIVEST